MNGYQRIDAALRGEKPDRVPVMLHNFMVAAKEAGYSQYEFGTDPHNAADAFIRLTEKYDLDGIIIDLDTATIAGALGVPIDYQETEPARCAYGGGLKSLDEVRSLPDPDVSKNDHLQVWLETAKLLKAYFGDEKYLRGSVDQAPFSIASMIRTPTVWMMDLMDYDNAENIHILLDYCTRASCQFIQLMADTGVHMVATGDSPAGPDMISPAMYSGFARSYEDRLGAYAHECGVKYLLHICGDTTVILDQFEGRPIDAIELDFKTDVYKAHELLKEVSFWGNIDPCGIFSRGTVDQVQKETRKLIDLFSDHPRFVLNSGCGLPPSTPEENIHAYIEEARRKR